MLNEMLSGLIRIKGGQDYEHLAAFLLKAIDNARELLETELNSQKVNQIQGEIAAYKGILKTFNDLEMLLELRKRASNQDNPNVDPDLAGDI